jgi:hypothetical protein
MGWRRPPQRGRPFWRANTMWRSAILAGLFLVLLGCDDPVFDVRVSSINEGGPVLADLVIIEQSTGQMFIPEDVVEATFTNLSKTSAALNDPDTFVNAFLLQRYTVSWRYAGSDPTLAGFDFSVFNFEGATSAVVPPGTSVVVGVQIAPAGMKTQDPFLSARSTGGYIQMIADIDFIGSKAVTSGPEIHIPVSLSVSFADFEDEN